MKFALLLFSLLAAALIAAGRGIGTASLGQNGNIAAWLPIPEGAIVLAANYDPPDLDFDAGRGNARLRSSQTLAELEPFFEKWLDRQGYVVIDGRSRVTVTVPSRPVFAKYACHRSQGRMLNIVGSEPANPSGNYSDVTLVYWESQDLALVQNLFGLKPGERPCDF